MHRPWAAAGTAARSTARVLTAVLLDGLLGCRLEEGGPAAAAVKLGVADEQLLAAARRSGTAIHGAGQAQLRGSDCSRATARIDVCSIVSSAHAPAYAFEGSLGLQRVELGSPGALSALLLRHRVRQRRQLLPELIFVGDGVARHGRKARAVLICCRGTRSSDRPR